MSFAEQYPEIKAEMGDAVDVFLAQIEPPHTSRNQEA